jgi:hypothetical protein
MNSRFSFLCPVFSVLCPLFSILCLLPAAVFAQDASPAPGETVSVRFMLYSWQSSLPELRYSPRHKTEALPDPFSSSAVHTYSGPPVLNFYAANASFAPDAPKPKPVATVTFPQGATRFTLLAARAPGGGYRIYAVPLDDVNTPAPSIRLHNFTETPLAVAYTDRNIAEIAPGSTTVIKPSGQAIVIRVATQKDGRWRRLFNNVAELGPDGRKDIILAPEGNRPVSMYSLPPWPKEPAAPATKS